LRLIDTGMTAEEQHKEYNCLYSFIQDKALRNPWCFEDVTIPEFYGPILEDMKQGNILVISDSSFQPSYKRGCAAWILEGTTCQQQITGRVITPGGDEDHSAYCSELSGILAALSVTNRIAKFHNITFPAVLMCDCEIGVERSFGTTRLTIQDPCYDLLTAIHDELSDSLILWSGAYIRGHQDDSIQFNQLDRPAQLNVLVNKMAKDYTQTAVSSLRHYKVHSSSWSISIDNILVTRCIDSVLYNLVHTPVAREYWIRKSRISADNFDDVLWTRLGQALDKMPLRRRIFCSKHTSGMCGVGKFQKLWKMRKTDSCPHCGLTEDAARVWQFKSPAVTEIWENSIHQLCKHLRKVDTDPDITTAIISYLKTWRSDQHLYTLENENLYYILELQDTIGARQVFEGWIHTEWEMIQERYYATTNSQRSSKRWTIALILKLWDVAWDLWDFRNAVFHDQQNISLQEDTLEMNIQVRDLYHDLAITGLLAKDSHLMTIPLSRLLGFPRLQKTEWIQQATLAMTQAKKRHFLSRQSRQEHHRRHQLMLQSMKIVLRNWLSA
jgi:hypothetical protein